MKLMLTRKICGNNPFTKIYEYRTNYLVADTTSQTDRQTWFPRKAFLNSLRSTFQNTLLKER
jgi:hypothetical protein